MKEKKEGEIYSYMLRFNKGLALDRQALQKITQFCRMTDMTMRDAILLIIATADVSALHNSILSLNVVPKNQKNREKNQEREQQNREEKNPQESQEKRAEEKEHNKKAEKEDRESSFRNVLPEERYIRESQEKEQFESSQEDNEDDMDLDSMIADIFNNF